MAAQHNDPSLAVWRKSTHSSQDGNCVEVASNMPGIVAIRDSKNRGGPMLIFSPREWQSFVSELRAEMFSL